MDYGLNFEKRTLCLEHVGRKLEEVLQRFRCGSIERYRLTITTKIKSHGLERHGVYNRESMHVSKRL